MFPHILAILLINTFYHSLGNPALIPSKRISVSILALESSCEDLILKSILKSKIQECSVIAPPYETKQLQCLMFYDMSAQLCSDLSASKLTMNEAYYNKINAEVDVKNLCEKTKDWVFSELQEYRSYKNKSEKLLKNQIACSKICGSDELTSNDANFFCKFYKWGLEVKTNIIPLSQNTTVVTVPVHKLPDTPNNLVETVQTSESQDISVKSTTSITNPKEVKVPSDPSATVSESSTMDKKQNIPDTTALNNQSVHKVPNKAKVEDTQGNAITPKKPIGVGVNENQKNQKLEKEVQNSNVSLPSPTNFGKDKNNSDFKHKEPVSENPKDNVVPEPDHYQEDDFNSEDGKLGNDDLQGDDDGDDPTLDEDIKQTKQKTVINDKIKLIDTSINNEISPRVLYTSSVQDLDVADDGDDHFFTFFLTAVVLVVLLYILYHDKSKISKLFFGLLVEGRQNGRRRTSRGHSYRRLDTLEQAMSTNSAAPPSKIIY